MFTHRIVCHHHEGIRINFQNNHFIYMSDWENKQKSFPRGVLRDKKISRWKLVSRRRLIKEIKNLAVLVMTNIYDSHAKWLIASNYHQAS